jgi:hypothetical protein
VKLAIAGEPHLTYCTNIHAGETWAEVRANLQRHVVRVKASVAPDRQFGVGLRLSAIAAAALAEPGELERFRVFLQERGLYVFTINGFPYGPFHGTRVKEEVYLPDWLDEARLDYSDCLAVLLAGLLPDEPGLEGTVSTVPGAYKARVRDASDAGRMAVLMVRHAAGLYRLHQRTGKMISLALEPEPCCHMETVGETVNFFEDHLFASTAVAAFRRLTSLGKGESEAALRRHLGVCFDACHMAVEFEDATQGLAALRRAGIRVGKVQVSAGLRVLMDPGDRTVVDALRPFAEGVYLHQVGGAAGRPAHALPGSARGAGGGGPGRRRPRRVADSLPRPALPRGARPVREYAGLSHGRATPPPPRASHSAPRGRDLYVGCAAGGVPARGHRDRRRPRAPLGPRAARSGVMSVDTAEGRPGAIRSPGGPPAAASRPAANRWRDYLLLGRVSNLPTVWTNTLAGAALAGTDVGVGRLTFLALAFSLLYTGGMYLNDAFDRDSDRRERPERRSRRAGSPRGPFSPWASASSRRACSW